MTGELSHYGVLNAIQVDLLNKRHTSADPYERSRLGILIANCVWMKQNPGDELCMAQMKRNAADLERYKAGRV